jgi:rubrerythrin
MYFKVAPALAVVLALLVLGTGMTIGAGTNLSSGTKVDISTAMHGEAFAYAKYMLYAKQAREHGDEKLAQLFEHTANIELNNHFATHAYEYGLVGTNRQNLKDSIAGENYETTTMYPQMAARAQAAGDSKVAAIFRAIAVDERTHRDRFQSALDVAATSR